MPKKLSLQPTKGKLLNKVIKTSLFIWFACIVGVFAIIGYVIGFRKELFDKAPDVFVFSLLGLILLGCLAFLVGVIGFTFYCPAYIQKVTEETKHFCFSRQVIPGSYNLTHLPAGLYSQTT